MMYPKPKSAPAGRMAQSKLAKNRTNAMKEMEAWARKADDAGTSNASRMSGQLSDNVTEERMLRAKLWELSKERYKFLAQNAYEKKVFTDRMQRKSSLFLRRASSAALSTCSEGESSRSGRSTAKQRWQNARLALVDRMDPTKRNKSAQPALGGDSSAQDVPDCSAGLPPSQEDDKREERQARGKGSARSGRGGLTPSATPVSNRPSSSSMGGNKLSPIPLPSIAAASIDREEIPTGKPPVSPLPLGFARNVKFDKSSTDTKGLRQSAAEARGLSPRRIPSAPGLGLTRPPSASVASSKPNSATSQRSKPLAFSTTCQAATAAFQGKQGILANRYGMRLESKTKDPRYSMLEKSLSPLQKRRNPADVTSIVKSFDSLHLPPRRRKEAKPKIELKALEYMEEQGFLF